MYKVGNKFFDYGEAEINYLKSRDRILGEAIENMGRVERTVIPDLFEALVFAIVGQLISAKASHTIWERMQSRLGEITPSNISRHSLEVIQACGITMKKAKYIKNAAISIMNGTINLNRLYSLSDDEVIMELSALEGIGRWTAEMLLLNSMERPDIVSYGDIAIRRGMCKLYGLSEISRPQFKVYKALYSPCGSVASIYLWEYSFK